MSSEDFAQIHVHQVGDAIQPSYTLSSPSTLAFTQESREQYISSSKLNILDNQQGLTV